ncbi:polymer-forming cytoskeletal protein, partial [Vibrio sp. 1074]|nr:polymer-forming cytoskeletal protein [Vibrio sp. 1074]
LVVRVIPNDIDKIALDANYYLTFTMVGDSAKEQTVNFMFTPFMFEAYSNERRTLNEIRVIAGKPENVHTRLLACASTGEPVVASNYNGKPKVVHPLIKPLGGSEGDFSYSAEFKDGLSEHGLITNESGLFEVTLSDQFECKGFSECPDDGTVEVTGKFNVYSRPWTLAICENQNTLPSGTSEQGDKFIAA